MNEHYEKIKKATSDKSVTDLVWEALLTDASHHKQWYLEAIGLKLGVEIDLAGHTWGIAP